MTEKGNANLVNGVWKGSIAGGRFDAPIAALPRPADDACSRQSWPASDPADVSEVLAVLEAGAERWAAVPRTERGLRLARAFRALEHDLDAKEMATRALLLSADEVHPHLDGLSTRHEAVVDHDARGITLCAPDGRDLFDGLLRTAGRELENGCACLLVSDRDLPFLADRLAVALLEAGVEADVFGLLHGLTREGRTAALHDRRVTAVSVSGPKEGIAWWRSSADDAGVERQRLDLLRARGAAVSADEDLRDAARRIVDESVGRSRTLSGQARDQVARVYCPEVCFSAFSEELLSALEASDAATDPIPLIGTDTIEHVRAQWAAGLDDGATLIFGGEELVTSSSGRRVMPTVFTNVEEHMECARRQEPMPILSLLRIPRERPRD